jgi:aspartokinase-like uncharacterized kinase
LNTNTNPAPSTEKGEHRLSFIIKVGGGLLASVGDLDRVLTAVAALSCHHPTLIVPGGGPFADEIRRVDASLGLPGDAAHWMAVLAMDQYAHLLAARVPRGVVVTSVVDARAQADRGRVPVIAPSRWLQEADPLPHTWDVTSDSIAAWIAVQAGARALVLVKPRGASGDMVDPHFRRVVPARLTPLIVTADRVEDALAEAVLRVQPDAST